MSGGHDPEELLSLKAQAWARFDRILGAKVVDVEVHPDGDVRVHVAARGTDEGAILVVPKSGFHFHDDPESP